MRNAGVIHTHSLPNTRSNTGTRSFAITHTRTHSISLSLTPMHTSSLSLRQKILLHTSASTSVVVATELHYVYFSSCAFISIRIPLFLCTRPHTRAHSKHAPRPDQGCCSTSALPSATPSPPPQLHMCMFERERESVCVRVCARC